MKHLVIVFILVGLFFVQLAPVGRVRMVCGPTYASTGKTKCEQQVVSRGRLLYKTLREQHKRSVWYVRD